MPMWFLEIRKQNWKTQSFRKSLSTVNLLLEFASCKQHFLWRSSHRPYKSAVSQAKDGSSSENSAHRWAQSPKLVTLFGGVSEIQNEASFIQFRLM